MGFNLGTNLPSATTTSDGVDWIFGFILLLSVIFFALIVALGTWFVIKYRARPGHSAEDSPSHNTRLEIIWSVIPGILVCFIFYYGFTIYLDNKQVPPSPYEVQVTAFKWGWSFDYAEGASTDVLHVPAGRPVRLVMSSSDVIHSLYVPNFRVKMDCVPGRYTELWFEAKEPGEHKLFCAEYCGTKHSQMVTKVIVHSQGEFDAWVEAESNFLDRVTPAEGGERLVKTKGCLQCHSLDGSGNTGPTFKNSWGTERALADGSKQVMDENYVRQSLLDPASQIVAGYQPQMPTYKGRLDDREINAIIAYLKTLKD